MSELYRRVILKPVGLDENQLSQLASSLAAAVELQNQLAAGSAHVLQFVGGLQETERTFFVEHEPAEPLVLDDLFDSTSTPIGEKTLLRAAEALFGALQAAHQTAGARPVVHGGLCPAVLLITPDGVNKVADFGFAPAICSALGPESYLNLAVSPRMEGPSATADLRSEVLGTAAWEVLDRRVVDRSDRLCSFIDPEKYALRTYQSFEHKSDIIAAGFILHLLAERRHPYFHDDPEAHRMVEVAEYMAMGTATRARRKELRESSDPAVRAWCELVARMIDRLPQNRPAAAALVEELSRHYHPMAPASPLESRFEVLCDRLDRMAFEQVRWEDVARDAGLVADAETLPAGLTEQAKLVVRLSQIAIGMRSDAWQDAAQPLAELSAIPGLPPVVLRKAQQATAAIDRSLAAQQELDRIETAVRAAEQSAPSDLLNKVTLLQDQLSALGAGKPFDPAQGKPLLPPVKTRVERLAGELATLGEEGGPLAAERERVAREWLAALRTAAEARQWDVVEQQLSRRPRLPRSLADLHAEVVEIEDRVHRRRELAGQLKQAAECLAAGSIADARRLAEEVEAQDVHPDMAEEAHRLGEQIDEEERRLRVQQEKIEQARAQVDELLAAAEQDFGKDTPEDLQQAETRVVKAFEIEEISRPQRQRGEKLRALIAKRQSELATEAQLRAAALARAADELRESRALLEAGHFAKAEERVKPHLASDFPDIQQEAEVLVTQIAAGLSRYRGDLRRQLHTAEEHRRKGRLQQAIEAARRVDKDEHADDALRTEARQTMAAAQAALSEIERGRLKAVSDRDQALTGLREGDLQDARTSSQSVLDNPEAEAEVRADAERVLAALPGLEAAKAFMDGEDFPGAIAAFDHLLRPDEGPVWPPVRAAAELLKIRAGQLRKEKLVDGIHRHLAHRAQREEASPEVGMVPPDESLAPSAPGWVRTTLTDFETFLQDCAVTGRPAPPERTLAPGDRLGEKYEILEFLGRGGMGEVYRARDLSLDREVALKLAAPAAESTHLAEALRNEAKAIAALTHPHIIHINSFDVIDNRPCFDTNYVRGRDLHQYANQRSLSWQEMAQILIPIAEALAYAHKQGVLHQDVKPQNIYLGEHPNEGPWLIDFGLARMRTLYDRRANTGLCGTPGFIAPEVITSMGESVDQRADIFALGCVLYGLLAKEAPFQRGESLSAPSTTGSRLQAAPTGSSVSRTLLNTLRSQTIPLDTAAPDAPETLRQICRRAMAHEPQDRYQDAGEIARDLKRFLLQLDRQEAESALARARARFEERPRNEPAEIDALDEVATLAEGARRLAEEVRRRCDQTAELVDDALTHAIDDVARLSDKLSEDAQRLKLRIISSQEEAGGRLKLAGNSAAQGRFRAALAAARIVLANPYVPDLHAEAKRIADEASLRVRAAMQKAVRFGGASVVALAILSAVTWFGFLRPFPPKIALAPKDTVVNLGETATFALQASGRPKPAYRWQRKVEGVWADLPGKTQAWLSVGPVQREDAGEYQCVVGNGRGPDQRFAARLTVNEPPPPAQYALSIGKEGEGTVELSPPGDQFTEGSRVRLTAEPAPGWRFERWEGDLAGSQPQAELAMDAARNVKAVFVQVVVMHKLLLDRRGEGLIDAAPAGGPYVQGTQVSLAAKPVEGWRFDHWEGDLTGAEPQATLKMDKDISVVAVFVKLPPMQALTLGKLGEGTVEAVPEGDRHVAGTEVTLTAKPAEGWRFDHWEGDLAGAELQGKLVMDKSKSVTAVFVRVLPMRTLSLSKEGEGAIDALPPGGEYVQGTEVIITASPSEGWRFDRWEAEPALEGNPVKVRMDVPRTIKAVFIQVGWPRFAEPVLLSIKGLLVGEQGSGSPLKGYKPEWVGLNSEGGKLHLTLSYPGYGGMLSRPAISIPFPAAGWPADASQQPAKAAEAIVTALQQAVSADAGLNNLFKYFAFWEQRQTLEKDLVAELSAGSDGPVPLDPGKLSGKTGYLTRLARIKWLSADVPDTPAFTEWTRHVQDTLEKNRGVQQIPIQVRPTRFIEYFWGPQSVHAIYWFANQPGSATAWYVRLGPSAELGPQVIDLVARKTATPELGNRLLGPIIRDGTAPGGSASFFQVTNPNKSFGLALAPDGPLCFISMLRLPFDPVAVDMSVPDAAQISDVLKHLAGNITELSALYTGVFGTAHTAAWVLVSLAPAPPADKALTPTELWDVPGGMMIVQEGSAQTAGQRPLAPVQSVRDFGKAFNAEVVCFRSDQVAVATAVQTGIRAVDKRFNGGEGGEVFDAGYLCPRVGDAQAPWFTLVASPIPSGK